MCDTSRSVRARLLKSNGECNMQRIGGCSLKLDHQMVVECSSVFVWQFTHTLQDMIFKNNFENFSIFHNTKPRQHQNTFSLNFINFTFLPHFITTFDVHSAVHRNIFPQQNQPDAPVSQIYLFLRNTLHVSDGLSVHRQEFTPVHTATGICQSDTATACCLQS